MGEWSPDKGGELIFKWTVVTKTQSFLVQGFYGGQAFLRSEVDRESPQLSFRLLGEFRRSLTSGRLSYGSSQPGCYKLLVEHLTYGRAALGDYVLDRVEESRQTDSEVGQGKSRSAGKKSSRKRRSSGKRAPRTGQ